MRARNGRVVPGDVVVAVNGKKVENTDDLLGLLEGHEVGEAVVLTIVREKAQLEVRLKLAAPPR
jgi:S1-C subfamily serine protease